MNWYLKVLKQYADFKGRARRTEYWMFTLINVIFIIGIQTLAFATEVPVLAFVCVLYVFGVLVPSLAVAARRMHDVGKSGWYALIPVYSIILAFTAGDSGDNQYGADPKAIEEITLQKV